MQSLALVLVLGVAALLLAGTVARAMRPRIRRGFLPQTPEGMWSTTAAELPWRDRWLLFWANTLGRAAPRRLAAPAVQRGEAALSVIERLLTKGSATRRMWWVMGALWAVLLLGTAARLLAGHREVGTWLSLTGEVLGLAAVFATMGPPQRWQARLVRRSVEANRRRCACDDEALGRDAG